jgi:hypothetical protein
MEVALRPDENTGGSGLRAPDGAAARSTRDAPDQTAVLMNAPSIERWGMGKTKTERPQP